MMSDKEQQRYEDAKNEVKRMRGFYIHLTVYILVNIFLIYVDNGNNYGFDSIEIADFYTAFFWGIGLFFHWLAVFGRNFILGKKWEERKIQELMEKERQKRAHWE